MPKVVLGGDVHREFHRNNSAEVREILFPTVAQRDDVPIGAQGTMYLTRIPRIRNYRAGDRLEYSDGRPINNAVLRVDPGTSPMKYKITTVPEIPPAPAEEN